MCKSLHFKFLLQNIVSWAENAFKLANPESTVKLALEIRITSETVDSEFVYLVIISKLVNWDVVV